MIVAEEEVTGLKLKVVEADLSRKKGDGEFLLAEAKDLKSVGFRNC